LVTHPTFELFDIPLRAGRLFDEQDGPDEGYVGLTLVTAGLLASMIPARRSTRVDPMVTMQAE